MLDPHLPRLVAEDAAARARAVRASTEALLVAHVVTLANLAERWAVEVKQIRPRCTDRVNTHNERCLAEVASRRDAYFNALVEADRTLTKFLAWRP